MNAYLLAGWAGTVVDLRPPRVLLRDETVVRLR
jgi:hypothetical protein